MIVKTWGRRQVVYRSVREGGRVRSRYVGSGLGAVLQAEDDAVERIEAHDRRRRERRLDRDEEQNLIGWSRDVERLVRAILTIAGYHRHCRGPWRRRNMDLAQPAALSKPPGEVLSPEAMAILARVRAGDLDLSSADARTLIRAMPEMARVAGSPSDRLVDTLLERHYQGGLYREAMRHHFEQVRADLAGPSPTAIEAILAERAAVCWLASNCYERAAEAATGGSVADALLRQRRIDGAHRRFLAALKALATVRKLALPDLKLTIDRRSVHVRGQAVPRTRDAPERVIEVEGRPA